LFPNSCAAAATTISETIPDELLRAFATEAKKKRERKDFFFYFLLLSQFHCVNHFFFACLLFLNGACDALASSSHIPHPLTPK
jgi:hypothetical protein